MTNQLYHTQSSFIWNFSGITRVGYPNPKFPMNIFINLNPSFFTWPKIVESLAKSDAPEIAYVVVAALFSMSFFLQIVKVLKNSETDPGLF